MMSATVESPMPWRKANTSIASNQIAPGTLFRSVSSQSNLAVSGTSAFAVQCPTSNVRKDVEHDVLLPDGAGSSVTFKLHAPREKTPTTGGLFSSLVCGGQSIHSGVGTSRVSSKLSRHLQIDAFPSAGLSKPAGRHHRLLSKSSDALTDIPFSEPAHPEVGDLFSDVVTARSWKPVSPQPLPTYSLNPLLSKNVVDPALALKSESVPSVRCELVAELLDTDFCFMPLDPSNHLQLLILDCRPFVSYNSNHIRGALNVSCSDCITRKRLLTGRASLGDLVSGMDDAKEQYQRALSSARSDAGSVQVVVYDDDTEDFDSLPIGHPLRLVVSSLRKTLNDVYYIFGGLKAFHKEYSFLCSRPGCPLNRSITRSPSTPAPDSCKIDNAKISQILPFLFIGNEHDAGDRALLKQLSISYVINVTSHVPLHFESDGVTYARFPAADSGTENLRQYFDEAIRFIDCAREKQGNILIHCQAGVSRSSTIGIAYIMARSSLGMLDCFRFVKSRRSVVAPNFNFLGQLLDFESAIKQGLVARRPDLEINGLAVTDPTTPLSHRALCSETLFNAT